jgi:hypothetical protein
MGKKHKALETLIVVQILKDFQQKFEEIDRILQKNYFKYCKRGKIGDFSYCFVEINRNVLSKASLTLKYKKVFIDHFINLHSLTGSDMDLDYSDIYLSLTSSISKTLNRSFTESLLYLMTYFSTYNLFPSSNSLKKPSLFCQICKKYLCSQHHNKQAKTLSHILIPSDYSPFILPNNWKGKYLQNYQKGPNSYLWYKSFPSKQLKSLSIPKLFSNNSPKALPNPLFPEISKETKEKKISNFNTLTPKLSVEKTFKPMTWRLQMNNSSINCSCQECSESCPCIQGIRETPDKKSFAFRGHCEVYCKCSLACSFKFLGCDCEGPCLETDCICFSNNIECDPWLCRRCGSLQEVQRNIETCGNIRIQKGKGRKRVGLRVSNVEGAGIGVFAEERIGRGEFVGEYTGEIVSEREANRRGVFYDANQHSFLFMVDSIVTIDATFYANELRYVNHARNDLANAETVNWRVLGTTKIMVLAKDDILKGQEIFFDYKYPSSVDYLWFKDYNSRLNKKESQK